MNEYPMILSIRISEKHYKYLKDLGIEPAIYFRNKLDNDMDSDLQKAKLIQELEEKLTNLKKELKNSKKQKEINTKEAIKLRQECLSKIKIEKGTMSYETSDVIGDYVNRIAKLTSRNPVDVYKEIEKEARHG